MAAQTWTSSGNRSWENIPDYNAKCCIYLIEHNAPGRKYVGQTVGRVSGRWSNHMSSRSGTSCFIKNALLKHGIEEFTFSVLDKCSSPEQLDERERYWIDCLGTLHPLGFNLVAGGHDLKKYSAESREKMRQSKMAYWDRVGRPGRKPTPQRPRKWTDAELAERHAAGLAGGWPDGMKHTDEARRKIAESKKRAVVRSDGVVFGSLQEAATAVGVVSGCVWRVLNGTRKTTGGFGFRYLEG
jgi:group I intron endonuclease